MADLFAPGYDPTPLEGNALAAKTVSQDNHTLLQQLQTELAAVKAYVDELEGLLKNNTFGLAKLESFADDIPAIKAQTDKLSHSTFGLAALKGLLDHLKNLLQHSTFGLAKLESFVDDIPAVKVQTDKLNHSHYGLAPLKALLDSLKALLQHNTFGLAKLEGHVKLLPGLNTRLTALEAQLDALQQAVPAPGVLVSAPLTGDPRALQWQAVPAGHLYGEDRTDSLESAGSYRLLSYVVPGGTSGYHRNTSQNKRWLTLINYTQGGGYLLHLLAGGYIQKLRFTVDGQVTVLTTTPTSLRLHHGPLERYVLAGYYRGYCYRSVLGSLQQPHVPLLRFEQSLKVEYWRNNDDAHYSTSRSGRANSYYTYVTDQQLASAMIT